MILKVRLNMRKLYFPTSLLLMFPFILVSCLNENEGNKREVTGYEEYLLTVASEKVQGLAFSGGGNFVTDVYAVKREKSNEWEPFVYIGKFDYESGYEYQIRISQTNYLDYNMGDPAWSEYELLEILSKERKDSEGLPDSFIPSWYEEEFSK